MCGVIFPYNHLARINFRASEIRGRILSPSLVLKAQLNTQPLISAVLPRVPSIPSSFVTIRQKVPMSSAPSWWPQGVEVAKQGGTPMPRSSHCHSAPVPLFSLLSKGQPEVCTRASMGEQLSPAIPATAQALIPRTSRHTHALPAPSPSLSLSLPCK